jgi:ubiquitin-protein ligase
MDLYKKKYLKYKAKYQLLKSQYGGNKRLMKDIKELNLNPIQGIHLEPTDNLFIQYATITGPPDTPYEGYMWRVRLNFPPDYPFKPPTATFLNKIFHPNIGYDSGSVCISILKEDASSLGDPLLQSWNPSLNISGILQSIQTMLPDGNSDSPLNVDAAKLLRNNRAAYNDKVRQEARIHALVAPEF